MASACSVAVATETKSSGSDFLRTSASTCVLVTVSFVCACFLVVCGVLVVREYSLAVPYKETSCRLKNITYTSQVVNCVYCSGFKDKNKGDVNAASCVASQFPCARLIVTYEVDDVIYEALLHPDSLQATGAYSKCSFGVCKKTKEESEQVVFDFVTEWQNRVDTSFSCFYDTVTSGSVIAHKMYTRSDVIHTMLWPSLIVVACAAIFLRIEAKRRRLTLCGQRSSSAEEEVPIESFHGSAEVGLESDDSRRLIIRNDLLLRPWDGGEGHPEECAARGGNIYMAPGHRTMIGSCGCRFVYKSLPSLIVQQTVNDSRKQSRLNGSKGKRSLSTDHGYLYEDA